MPPPDGVGGPLSADLDGFSGDAARIQRALEARFLSVPDPDSAWASATWLAARPHPAGSPGLLELSGVLADRLRGLGFRVEVERYDVWLPHPVDLRLALTRPEPRELSVREPDGTGPRGLEPRGAGRGCAGGGEPNREESGDAPPDWWLAWNAYAASGEVEGDVVYVGYGRREDYDALDEAGVEVAGRIALARYGVVYRGVKVREAESRGAVGVVLYSDPAEDGFARGDTLPLGPYRPAAGVQRGTVSYLWRRTGDPLTPGRPSLPGEPRLEPVDSEVLPTIPVLSLGYGEAESILRALGGPEAPEAFRGALSVPYRLGPGPARLHLRVETDVRRRPVENVIARLPGREPAQVILGNHYDAWLYGATDPHSGTAAMLEIARALAALAREGWRPRREIVLAFWDAEEFGVIGSTEWVERHRGSLQERAVAYLNVDTFVAGVLDVAGSPSLRDLVVAAAEAVEDPETGGPLAEAWRERQRAAGARSGAERAHGCDAVAAACPGGEPAELPRLGDLGAGSDWTAFLHHAGVPSLQWTMNGRGSYAVYHSALDDLAYLRTHADPELRHSPALARVMGLTALRLAEAEALPFRYVRYADRIEEALRTLEGDVRRRGRVAPAVEAGLERTRERLAAFRRAADGMERRRRAALRTDDAEALAEINRLLPRVEGAFLHEDGLPGRPWYRHQLVAADPEDGYGPLLLPAAREALRAGDPEAIARGLDRVGEALDRASRRLSSLDALESTAPSELRSIPGSAHHR